MQTTYAIVREAGHSRDYVNSVIDLMLAGLGDETADRTKAIEGIAREADFSLIEAIRAAGHAELASALTRHTSFIRIH